MSSRAHSGQLTANYINHSAARTRVRPFVFARGEPAPPASTAACCADNDGARRCSRGGELLADRPATPAACHYPYLRPPINRTFHNNIRRVARSGGPLAAASGSLGACVSPLFLSPIRICGLLASSRPPQLPTKWPLESLSAPIGWSQFASSPDRGAFGRRAAS